MVERQRTLEACGAHCYGGRRRSSFLAVLPRLSAPHAHQPIKSLSGGTGASGVHMKPVTLKRGMSRREGRGVAGKGRGYATSTNNAVT